MKLSHLADPEPLFAKVSENILENAGFIFRASDNQFDIYADEELTAAVAIQKNSDHCIFWGQWDDIEIPFDVLPKDVSQEYDQAYQDVRSTNSASVIRYSLEI